MLADTHVFDRGAALYPQPIAISCGRICRARNIQEQLSGLLKCAETVARYVAALAMSSFAARTDPTIQSPGVYQQFRGNLSFGHFVDVAYGVANSAADHPIKAEITAAFKARQAHKSAHASLSTLVTLRNQLGHNLESLSELRAQAIVDDQAVAQQLTTALQALEPLLILPLFLLEEQRYEHGDFLGRRLLLMGETSTPRPVEIAVTHVFKHNRELYIGMRDGALRLYPTLLWEPDAAKMNYAVYFLHAITPQRLKYTTVSDDTLEQDATVANHLSERMDRASVSVEVVTLKDGSSFLGEWLHQKRGLDRLRQELSGHIPWRDLDTHTIQWYAKQLDASVSDEQARRAIIDRVLDGRARLTPEEVQEWILLFGRADIVKRMLARKTIDLRARTNPENRWDERDEVEGNVLEALKRAITFFTRHIGQQGITIDGLRATSGSADYIAMREGLVNLFIHQDYSDRSTVAHVEITEHHAVFHNPGSSLVSQSMLAEGGKSSARNPLMSRAFREIGFAELAGSGLREVNRVWRNEKRQPPTVNTNAEANTFTLTLDWRPMPDISDEVWKRRIGATVSPQESHVLILAARPSGVSAEEIAAAQGISIKDAQSLIQQLVTRQFVTERHGRTLLHEHLRSVVEEAQAHHQRAQPPSDER